MKIFICDMSKHASREFSVPYWYWLHNPVLCMHKSGPVSEGRTFITPVYLIVGMDLSLIQI